MASRIKTSVVIGMVATALISGAEGLRTQAYKDPVGIPTICFGETRGVKIGDTATREQCRAMLDGRLVEISAAIDRCLVTAVPDMSYAALLSLAYNIGSGAFCASTLVKKANAGDVAGACEEILRWDKAGGVALPGLTRRRGDEHDLCRQGLGGKPHSRGAGI
ncbi:lysozyme [Paramagnetospirillum magneticum]|uniref:Lysozyme n=1 Tax=Paramagnetospirillum magneticum (strain ATCC 700264 / AMB-1) TaxID=342108 RepID=Q2W746_PARM1|nr:lysozyme [Paramagnetospirillum magneticum]BAE50329.1 Phage-related lysozyme [Paramagnetospirillum magneticum AMB-1]